MKDLVLFFHNFSPYAQLIIVYVLLTGTLVYYTLSEGKIISTGIYIFSGWMLVSFLLSFFADAYWWYMLHWLLAIIAYFIYWFSALQFCNRFGKPYSGDGAMVLIIPIYLFPVTMVSSALLKGIIYLTGYIF